MTRGRTYALAAVGIVLALAAAIWVGGRSKSKRDGIGQAEVHRQAAEESEQTFRYAMNLVLRHEEFDAATTFGEALQRLNQWIRHQEPPSGWTLDPLVSGLPPPLLQIAPMQGLGAMKFEAFDRMHLQEAVWMRDAAASARGKSLDPVARASSLFDWVVRNIELEPPARPGGDLMDGVESRLPRLPAETLLYGRGAAVDRAWVFILLARQQHLEVVLLAFADPEAAGGARTWAPALLHGGELYVFEPTLGLPIPGPDGQGVATLAQLRADDALLRQLDVDAEHRYPVEASELQDVAAFLEASPGFLAQRMRLVQSHLAGDEALVLSANPGRVAAQLREIPGVVDVLVWSLPQFTYLRLQSPGGVSPEAAAQFRRDVLPFNAEALPPQPPSLRTASLAMQRGRVLQIKGRTEGPEGAGAYYREARLPDSEIDAPGLSAEQREQLNDIKQNATYWLGLMSQDHQRWESAVDYFQNRLLKPYPDCVWAPGAHYNLGRSLEALGRTAEAIAAYEAPSDSPYWWGNQLRIRALRPPTSEVGAAPTAPIGAPDQEPSPSTPAPSDD